MKELIKLCFICLGLLSIPVVPLADVIMSNDMEAGTLSGIFDDVNEYGGVIVGLSTDVAHSGSRSVKITYPVDEAGVELKITPFTATRSLYTRKYEYYAPGWEGNWPVGLKTSRYFTTPNFSNTNTAYMSEKLIWQTYSTSCSENYALGMNNAISDLDLETTYRTTTLFGNGLPYIRTGRWYKYETWMVLDSAVDAGDGVLQIWIDGNLVYSNAQVPWRSTSRGTAGSTSGWQSMWFGGNYSGAVCGNPSQALVRYIDDVYVSTTLDIENRPNPPVLLP